SPEAKRLLADLPIDPRSGARVSGGGFIEHFRLSDGRVADTQYRLLPREVQTAMRPDSEDGDTSGLDDGADVVGDLYGNLTTRREPEPDLFDPFGERPAQPRGRRAQGEGYEGSRSPSWPGTQRSPFGEDEPPRARRRDPDYLFGDDPRY
ncbi:hypothetical protein MBTS_23025, partial [Methylobacterium bullatum]|nr:hypothetical protein [Methylobacterium bullatum]